MPETVDFDLMDLISKLIKKECDQVETTLTLAESG